MKKNNKNGFFQKKKKRKHATEPNCMFYVAIS